MIEQGRTDGLVPSKTEVVGEARLEKVRVEGRREARVSIQLLLVPAAIGEEEFIGVSPVLVNPESHGRISNRVSGDKDKVVPQRISSIWIRVNRQEGKNILCDRADASDLVAGEGGAALHAAHSLGRGRIKDLACQDRSAIARIRLPGGCTEELREIALALRVRGQRRDAGSAQVIAILLPREEKEGLVMTVVKLGNSHRPPEAATEIVLMVAGLKIRPVRNVVPGDGVPLVVMKQVKRSAMIRISAGLGGKRFDAAGRTAELSGNSRGGNLELANGFNRGSVFIKSWTKLGVSNTRAIEYDFSTQILAAGNFGFENTRRGRVAERSWTNSAGS